MQIPSDADVYCSYCGLKSRLLILSAEFAISILRKIAGQMTFVVSRNEAPELSGGVAPLRVPTLPRSAQITCTPSGGLAVCLISISQLSRAVAKRSSYIAVLSPLFLSGHFLTKCVQSLFHLPVNELYNFRIYRDAYVRQPVPWPTVPQTHLDTTANSPRPERETQQKYEQSRKGSEGSFLLILPLERQVPPSSRAYSPLHLLFGLVRHVVTGHLLANDIWFSGMGLYDRVRNQCIHPPTPCVSS